MLNWINTIEDLRQTFQLNHKYKVSIDGISFFADSRKKNSASEPIKCYVCVLFVESF